ncbi:DUF7133 domain-containing protein [Membranihabitans maritimus]|uniref:DUF7133 domain-containing protein n=1 Tax=Membranihabitans maritimus TaxID=2904244 RepID=UPI001F1BA81E|nr:hypothetical protein [Membranihabitans maritimus]
MKGFKLALLWLVLNSCSNSNDVKVDNHLPGTTFSQSIIIDTIAMEPEIINPMSLALAENGDIFVSLSHTYRYGEEGAPVEEITNPIKRIRLDKKGKIKEIDIVADGFEDPVLGLDVFEGKLYATNRDIVFSMDIDENGSRATNRQILVKDSADSWNPFGLYRVKVGPDNKLWIATADHPVSKPVTLRGVDGKVVRLSGQSGGMVRCNLDGSGLEKIVEGLRAPYAFDIDPWGHVWMISNGEGSPNIYLDVIPGMDYGYASRDVTFNWLAGKTELSPPVYEMGNGANTTAFHYYSSMFHKNYWGNIMVSNWGSHGYNPNNRLIRLFERDSLGDLGIGERDSAFFTMFGDTLFRPTSIEYAPDGGLYLSDWHSRDDESNNMGRIYKFSTRENAVGETGVFNIDFDNSEHAKLITLLNASNHSIRERAAKVLCNEFSNSIADALGNLAAEGTSFGAAESIWVLSRVNTFEAYKAMKNGMMHRDGKVRAHCLRQLRQMAGQDLKGGTYKNTSLHERSGFLEDHYKFVNNFHVDDDPEVRIEAALALPDSRKVMDIFSENIGSISDRRLKYLIGNYIGRHGHNNILLVKNLFESDSKKAQEIALIAIETALDKNEALKGVVSKWELPKIFRENKGELLKEQLISGHTISSNIEKIEVLKVLNNKSISDPSLFEFLEECLQSENDEILIQSIRILKENKLSDNGKSQLIDLSLNNDNNLVRIESISALAKNYQDEDIGHWKKLVNDPSKDISISTIRAMSELFQNAKSKKLIQSLINNTIKKDAELKEETLLLMGDDLDEQIESDNKNIELEVQNKIQSASAVRGEYLFHSREGLCSTCHSLERDVKTKLVGPNLTAIGNSVSEKYLIESVLFPSKDVKTGYQLETVYTRDGKSYTGQTEMGENTLNIHIFNSDPVELELNDIQRRVKNKMSLMPGGYGIKFTPLEIADIISYLLTLKG